nr:peptidoglycan editing factor PgeF [Chloroflexota bacterium]
MIRRIANSIVFYQFASLTHYEELLHAVFTRIGGTSQGSFQSLNVGHFIGDDDTAVQSNHERIFQTLGIKADTVVTARQVHGEHVAVVGAAQWGTIMPATDSLVSAERGTALLLRFADCVPLMLYDPSRHAIGLVHVGWRGLFADVVLNTVAALRQAFACNPCHLVAGIGPAIGPCCYEVGPEVVAQVEQAFGAGSDLLLPQPNGTVHFDLPGAVRRQLQDLGVTQIEDSGLCTSCHTAEFFSHRAEHGRTGRFAAMLALR